jgi:hypothetical protein
MKDPRFSFNLDADLAAASTEQERAAIQAEIDSRKARADECAQVASRARKFKRPGSNWIADGDGWPEWNGGI